MSAIYNRSMHGIVLGGLDGYIMVFMHSLKCVLWPVDKVILVRRNMMGMNNRGYI